MRTKTQWSVVLNRTSIYITRTLRPLRGGLRTPKSHAAGCRQQRLACSTSNAFSESHRWLLRQPVQKNDWATRHHYAIAKIAQSGPAFPHQSPVQRAAVQGSAALRLDRRIVPWRGVPRSILMLTHRTPALRPDRRAIGSTGAETGLSQRV